MLVAAIEGGGTNFNCGLFDEHHKLVASERVPTTRPQETVSECAAFLLAAAAGTAISAAGLACFGPLNLDRRSGDYGALRETPKPHWAGFNVKQSFERALQVPTFIETDVGGSALGEHRFGAARGVDSFVYVTVGTGIGAAVIAQGKPGRGVTHYELGHVSVKRASGDDYPGNCPFHGDCLSGLACGPAITERWGRVAPELPAEHPAWDLEAHYLSEFCVSLIYSYAPARIVLGGGVMDAPGLLEKIRASVVAKLGGYHCDFLPGHPDGTLDSAERLNTVLVKPGLGAHSALFGALCLAEEGLSAACNS